MVRTSLFLSLSLLPLGCGPEKVTTETDADTTTSVTGGGVSDDSASEGQTSGLNCGLEPEKTDSCCCFSIADEDSGKPTDTCPADLLCPELIIQCHRGDPDCALWDGFNGTPQPISVNDEEALGCVLEALNKGNPGLVTWTVDWGLPAVDRYYIQEGRTAYTYRADSDEGGLLYLFNSVTKQMLMPPEKFQLCAADPDLRERVRCLQVVTTGEPIETCN